jgi:hypothetical protein
MHLSSYGRLGFAVGLSCEALERGFCEGDDSSAARAGKSGR